MKQENFSTLQVESLEKILRTVEKIVYRLDWIEEVVLKSLDRIEAHLE